MLFLRSSCNVNENILKDTIMCDVFFQGHLRILTIITITMAEKEWLYVRVKQRPCLLWSQQIYNSPSFIRNKPAVIQQIMKMSV